MKNNTDIKDLLEQLPDDSLNELLTWAKGKTKRSPKGKSFREEYQEIIIRCLKPYNSKRDGTRKLTK